MTKVTVAVVLLFVFGSSPAAQHADHGAAHEATDQPDLYLTVNVAISAAGIEPAAVFVPLGQPVQLMLRNRGTSEHHYRVAGLTPDGLRWLDRHEDAPESAAGGNHDHHIRTFTATRAPSPAGIAPSGREVHGYVTGARIVDVVLFTPTQTGTFAVACDLHPQETAQFTVFEDPQRPAAAAAAGSTLALSRALTRELGAVAETNVEVTYAPPDYVAQVLGPAGVRQLQPDRYVTLLINEKSHRSNLPTAALTPELRVNGTPVALVDRRVLTDSVHHRATALQFARDDGFGRSHQVMTLRLAAGQEATWHLPLLLPRGGSAEADGLGGRWALILALLGGMLAAMWPCLFQLTVYFIPALAGAALQDASASSPAASNRRVLRAAFFFILGFTIVYTATGALIGYAAQRAGGTAEFESWQRYFGVGAGIIVIALALRVAAKVRAPLVCRMPVLSGIANSQQAASPIEMMLAGLAFATGCMTCFGSALVIVMVVYIGLAQSALYGALVLFLFSLGMGIPLVIAAVAMAKTLPLLLRLEKAVPWMGLVSAMLMVGFGVLLISGHYMIVSEWTYRLVGGAAALPTVASPALLAAAAAGAAVVAWLAWTGTGRVRQLVRRSAPAR
jgi:cytochrome c biogenesis protein CcdA